MRLLEEMYNQKKQELKAKLKGFKSKYSVTCDLWTSKNQLSFFGVTIHSFDNDWKLNEGLLAFKFLEGEHDGISLSKALIEVLEDYEIADRLLGVTADNASNNMKMMAYVESYYKEKYPNIGFSVAWNQVECLAHVLNLGAQQILKQFKQPLDKDTYEASSQSCDDMVTAVSRLSFLCRKIRLSPKLRRLLENICQQKGVKYSVPIIDVCTRWNSTYDMLVRAHEMRDVISDTIYHNKDNILIELLLNEKDWVCVCQMIEVLQPLKEATLLASTNGGSLMVTRMLPLYEYCTSSLKQSLLKFARSDDIYIGIEAAIEKLNHYYDKISPMVGIALILDPARKKQYLQDVLHWEPTWVASVMQHFQDSFEYYRKNVNVNNSDTISIATSIGGYGEYEKKRRIADSEAGSAEEYVRYFNAPLAKIGTDVLSFWKTHQVDYPILSAMAKDYLTVQASSVPSERAFSSGADLVTADRCTLAGKTIEMTQFLKFVL